MITQKFNSRIILKPTIKFPCWASTYHTVNHAHQLFEELPKQNFPCISNVMHGYIRQNQHMKALQYFKTELSRSYPHGIIEEHVAVAIKACRGEPKLGSALHTFAVTSGFIRCRSVLNSLMSMYCKAGKLDQAFKIFSCIDEPDTVAYNIILKTFEDQDDALAFARRMNATGVVFDAVTYSTLLSSCLDYKGFRFGVQLHCSIVKSGYEAELYIGNGLITFYTRRGCISDAERVFDGMVNKDKVSWNSMVCGYSKEGNYGLETIRMFHEMIRHGFKPDHIALTAVISACGYERNIAIGRLLHCFSIKVGYGSYCSVSNLLMSSYAKCMLNEDAKRVFHEMCDRNVVSWTTMISVFEEDALPLVNEMRMDGVDLNEVTCISLISAVTKEYSENKGRMIHGLCMSTGFISEVNVSNSLITMYAKIASMGDARKVFEELHYRDVVSWNTLISGYGQNELYQEALEAFHSAVSEVQPNQYTFGSMLSVVGSSEVISITFGERCHCHLLKLGLNACAVVSGALLDMYGKRGNLSASNKVFEDVIPKSQLVWTTMISAHARHGEGDSFLRIFYEMEKQGFKPDSITFLSMLTACGRLGMVDKGRELWDNMIKEELIDPSPEHYASMVDMLGRARKLKEAEEFLLQIPGGPSFSALQSLLGACRLHGDIKMGRRIADKLIEMEPDESGSYILMSNLYAEREDWEKVALMRTKMRDGKVRKEIGFSWVDMGAADGSRIMHKFSSDDISHPRSEEIYQMVGCLGLEIKGKEQKCLVDINI